MPNTPRSLVARGVTLLWLLLSAALHVNAQEKDLQEKLKVLDGPRYGRHCGFVGEDPSERIRTERLIQLKDKTGVMKMLFDKEPVLQAYGAEAVIRLQRQGVAFPARALDMVESLRTSRTQILVCSGCTHWLMPLNEALRNISINDL